VTLTWNSVLTADPAVTSCNIYHSTADGVTKNNGAVSSITADSHPTQSAIATFTIGTKYYFVVTAVNASGESTESSPEVSITP